MKNLSSYLIGQLRRKDLPRSLFRIHAHNLALCLAQETSQYLVTQNVSIQTPLGTAQGVTFARPIVLVPILRSGLVLLPAFVQYFPEAGIGCVGLKRDEKTAIAHLYYKNMPKLSGNEQIIVLDPMLATGGSLTSALEIIIQQGIKQEDIIYVGVIASQHGVDVVHQAFPKIRMIITATDKDMNPAKFIVPGLGDFGDRYFGTE